MEVSWREVIAARSIELAFLKLPNTLIELLMPLAPDTTIGKFLKSHGPGIHHICYEVKDIVRELARLKAIGHTLIDEVPRDGAFNSKIAFLYPKGFDGVLVELCSPGSKHL